MRLLLSNNPLIAPTKKRRKKKARESFCPASLPRINERAAYPYGTGLTKQKGLLAVIWSSWDNRQGVPYAGPVSGLLLYTPFGPEYKEHL